MSLTWQHRILAFLMGLQMICWLSGCPVSQPKQISKPPSEISPPPPPSSPSLPPPPIEYYDHTVRWNGETPSIIAAWSTDDKFNYNLLFQANSHLRDPARISVNDVIHIPRNLMKRQDPMPRAFVESFYPSSRPPRRGGAGRISDPSPLPPITPRE